MSPRRAILCSVAFAANFIASESAPLKWEERPGFRSAPLTNSQEGKAGFALLAPSDTGLTFTNILSDAKAAENQIRLNGSGVAAGDVDGDGLTDLYFCGLDNANRLFRNLGGWQFEDVTASAGVACENQYSSGCALADVDGDSDLDLLVNSVGGGTRLFINDGKGIFTERTNSGLVRRFGASSLALGDLDRDGDLDLYVANYRTTTIRTTGFALLSIGGKRSLRPQDREQLEYTPDGRVLEHGEPDCIYLNDGKGGFTQVGWTNGMFLEADGTPLANAPRDWGLTVMIRDINQDGSPDLYVCNDFHTPDRIWINNGKGQFKPLHERALRNTSTFSMSVDFADIDRDGDDDIFVADMLESDRRRRMVQFSSSEPAFTTPGDYVTRQQFDRNTLQLNRGDGAYAEIGYFAQLEASGWTWCSAFMDVDLDGYEDILMTTGHMFDTQDLDAAARIQAMGPFPREKIPGKLLLFPKMTAPKAAFQNTGKLRFEPRGADWNFNQGGVSHGMALADLDNDGDQDVVVNNLNGVCGIYRNESPASRIAVRLKGAAPNTRGVGARIEVTARGLPAQAQEMLSGGRYLSSDDSMRVFATATNDTNITVAVQWPSGKRSSVAGLGANRIYEISESNAQPGSNDNSPESTALFADASNQLPHKHVDEPYDDFARQPLLPNKLSQLGPGLCWGDFNGDGLEDLAIGSGRAGKLSVFIQRNGAFEPATAPWLAQPITRDQASLLALPLNGATRLLSAFSNYEDGLAAGVAIRGYQLNAPTPQEIAPAYDSSIGPMLSADFDNDGDLDLFVGGRVKPGRYPEPATSRLLLWDGQKFVIDPRAAKTLENVGLVAGACATDVNSDGWPDLVLSCEWGPVKIFVNNRGQLEDKSEALGLAPLKGWWTGIASGDFNNDGAMDLVAGNWGLNTKYRASAERPRRIYYGDVDQSGTVDTIEAHQESDGRWYPERELTSASDAIPTLKEKFATHASYALASVDQVYGEPLKKAQHLEVNHLATTIFLNRGDRFEAVPLPPEAQFAPVFGVCVADFDMDGQADIFLAQNFFAATPFTWRNDAGLGQLLRGDGRGGFRAVSAEESGIRIYGEQRAAAAADYDGDGRVDLAVTQNSAETKLFKNVGTNAGVRIALKGSAANPHGIGSSIRGAAVPAAGWEIQAGGGYWSQNSSTVVIQRPTDNGVVVRWPGGRHVRYTIPATAKAVQLTLEGKVDVLQ